MNTHKLVYTQGIIKIIIIIGKKKILKLIKINRGRTGEQGFGGGGGYSTDSPHQRARWRHYMCINLIYILSSHALPLIWRWAENHCLQTVLVLDSYDCGRKYEKPVLPLKDHAKHFIMQSSMMKARDSTLQPNQRPKPLCVSHFCADFYFYVFFKLLL